MESEEETGNRLVNFYRKYYDNGFEYKDIESLIELSGPEATKDIMIRFAKDYHSERIKQLTPSKVGVIELSKDWIDITVHRDADPYSFIKGFEKAIELLTKN
jgi:hypothetical protein